MSNAVSSSKPYKPMPVADYMSLPEEEMVAKLRYMAKVDNICLYEMAVRLYRVREEGLWKKEKYCSGKEYPTMGEWVWGELGFSPRKARYLVRIIERLIELEVPQDMIFDLLILGWAKANYLLRAASLEQLEQWCEECRGKASKALMDFVKIQQAQVIEGNGGEEILEEPMILKAKFFRKDQYGFVAQALEMIEEKYGVKSLPEALSFMAANYVGTTLPGGAESIPEELEIKLRALEEAYGVRLAVIPPADPAEPS